MITSHHSPKDFKKGKNAITKEALFKAILEKPYNTKEKHKGIDNFVASVCEETGEDCTTFTLKYGKRPLATWEYIEGEYESKADFIQACLTYAKGNSEIIDEAWAMRKAMAKTNGLNAKGGNALQVVS